MKKSVNKKFESKDQLIDWFSDELKKKGVQAAVLSIQEMSTGSEKVDQYMVKGYFVEM